MDESTVRELIQRDFPFLKTSHYLDSASVCPCPRQSVEAMTSFYYDHPLNYGVGDFQKSREVAQKVDEARATVAAFVGASPHEIVFTKNTTEAINTVSRGLAWKAGEGIVLTTLEHQSNVIPWLREAKEHTLEIHYLHPGQDGRVSPDDLEKIMDGHSIRMVAMTHVSNVFGTIQDISALVKVARERDALTLVDAAQSAGRISLEVSAVGCDFATFCGRKALMGPQGTGFLYAHRDWLKNLRPLSVGSRAADIVNWLDYRDKGPPHRFEAGVLNTSGVIGLGQSIRYLEQLTMEKVTQRIRDLTCMLINALSGVNEVILHSPRGVEAQAGIVSWNIHGVAPRSVSEWLDREATVAVATGHQGSRLVTQPLSADGVVRTSVHWFNNSDDIKALVEGLQQFLSVKRHV